MVMLAGMLALVAENETLLPTGATTLRLHHLLVSVEMAYDTGMATVTAAVPTASTFTALPNAVLHIG